MIRRQFLGATAAFPWCGVAAGLRHVSPERNDRQALPCAEVGRGPHLFLDEALIARTERMTRVVHPPRRLDGPVLDAARFGVTQPYLTVTADPEPDRACFRLWYNRGPAIWRAESDDGISWRDPRVAWALTRGYGASLVDDRDREPDPARRFKLANWQATRAKEDSPRDDGGMYAATSPDGLAWAPDPHNPVLPTWPSGWPRVERHGVGDTIDLFRDPIRGRYAAAVKLHALPEDGYAPAPKAGRIFRRLVGMTTSTDFRRWERPWRIFTPDDHDEGLLEFYGMGGVHARGPLLIGFVRVLRDDLPCDRGGPVDGIGYTVLATSRDGVTWQRDRVPFLDRDPAPGRWDHAMSWIGGVLPVGDELYLYYGGYARGHKIAADRERQIGMARMRRDRYVSQSAGRSGGMLLTCPIVIADESLQLNVHGPRGEAQVRVLDGDGRVRPGLGWDESIPIRGDHLSATAAWRSPSRLPRGETAQLEFRLRDADLFGFTFGDARG